MSSRPKKGHKTGDGGQKAKKDGSAPQPCSSTVAQKPPKQAKDDVAVEAQVISTTSRYAKDEMEIHEKAARHFQDMSIADRVTEEKLVTQPNTPESPYITDFTTGIGFNAGPGRWSYPNSAPNPGEYLTGLELEDFPHKEMADQALHMRATYDVLIALQPSFKDIVMRCTATGYYQILKERQKTKKSYEKRIDRYERMIENDITPQVPSIAYPGIIGRPLEMRLGSCSQQIAKTNFEKELETRAARQMRLAICLAPADKKAPAIIEDVGQDLSFCSNLVNQYDIELTEHPEFLRFRTTSRESLVVHGTDMKYKGEPTSKLSVFFWRIFEHLNQEAIVLVHSIGLCTSGRNQSNEHLKGSSGLFRSLCAQLLAWEDAIEDLALVWLNNKRLQDAGTKKHARVSLALFFRELVLDVAESASRQGFQKKIRVVIDGIDRLEKDKTLSDVMAVFRALADEIQFGPFESNFQFQYVLLHPQISRLAGELHPNERHVFLQRAVDTQEQKRKAVAGRKKGKGKAKREKAELEDGEVESEEEGDEEGDEQKTRRRQNELACHLVDAQVSVNPRLEPQTGTLGNMHLAAMERQPQWRAEIESFLQKGQIPVIRYRFIGDGSPGFPRGETIAIAAEVWVSSRKTGEFQKNVRNPEARYLAFWNALYGPECHKSIANERHYDRKKAQESLKQVVNNELVQAALEHPEMIHFPKPLSAGLILHGMGANWDKADKTAFTPFAGLLCAPYTASPDVIRLTYVAGIDTLNDPTSKSSLPGTVGCLRQLCLQLIQHSFSTNHGLKLSFVKDIARLEPIKKGGVIPLFTIFRMLLHDVANLVHENENLKRQTVEVIIDGAHWIEREPGFNDLINHFRILNDEIRVTELGRHLRFRYLIIHPTVCGILAYKPHIHERHLFWNSLGKFIEGTEDDPVRPSRGRKAQVDHLVEAIRCCTDEDEPPITGVEEIFSNWVAKRNYLRKEYNAERTPHLQYSGLQLESWSTHRKPRLLPPAQDLATAGMRRRRLELALNAGLKGGSRAALAREERRLCASEYMDVAFQQAVKLLFIHVETRDFYDGETHGLIIHDELMPGRRIPIAGERTEKALAAFINTFYVEEMKQGAIVLTHVMDSYAAKRGINERRDTVGILRSLCCQLIDCAFKKHGRPLELEYVDAMVLSKVQDLDGVSLCGLFRELLCDMAGYIARSEKPKQRIVAVVDCTQFVGSPDIQIGALIGTFRMILDEEVCELGQYIDFNYLLLRPVMDSLMGGHPDYLTVYPAERHIFFDDIGKELDAKDNSQGQTEVTA